MGLVGIINSFPLKLASKLVDRVGLSKYDLAQACNVSAGGFAAYAALDAYSNGQSGVAAGLTLLGGVFTVFNALHTYFNYKAKDVERDGYVEEIVDFAHRKDPHLRKDDLRAMAEAGLKVMRAENKKAAVVGFGMIAASVVTAAIVGVGMPTLNENPNMLFEDFMHFGLMFSPSLFFTGLSFYFRGASPKYESEEE